VAHSEPTQGISKAEPRDNHAVCTHPPILPFLLKQNYLQISLQEVISRDESFMPDISGYIRERVKVNMRWQYRHFKRWGY